MNKEKKAKIILSELERLYPDARTELTNWKTPFQFLVCIILSAQTTDAGVNKVTKGLFALFPDPQSFIHAPVENVEKLIKKINYYRTKAHHIVEASTMLVNEFKGEVPKTLEKLVKLPGVGYKTANVFLSGYYKKNAGIAVDTHVMRVAQRLALSEEKSPFEIAKDMEKIFDKKVWYKINSTFVLFGRYHCRARNPLCNSCPIIRLCSYPDRL